MLVKNPMKEKLDAGKAVLGTWNTLGSPMASEVLARTGLDFLVVDFEHGPFQLDKVHEYVSRCELHGASPIVRIPSNEEWMALQAFDQGAHGVMVPHIDGAEAARRLAKACKYHPLGARGYTPFTKAGGFTNHGAEDYSTRANSLTLSLIIVESKEGLDNLDAIVSVDGIDVVYFGAYDLSQALGVPGKVRDPKVLGAIEAGVRKVAAAGKAAGGFVAQSRDDMRWLLDMGMRFITFDVDSSVLLRPYQDAAEWFNKEAGR